MNTPENRVFAISDLHLLPDSDYNYVVDDRWPKKKLPYDPSTMYRSWADHIAREMDAYIYYIVDKDFTLGGACDVAIDTIEKYADTGDGIDWFLIDLPGAKSKLNLQSISPTEVNSLNKAIYTLHKGTDVTQVSKSLQTINNAKEKDVEQTFSKLKKLETIINETANYNTRFMITEHCWREMMRWADTKLHRENVKNKELETFYNHVLDKSTHDNREQISLFPNLDLSNQYIEHLDASIGEFTFKTRGRGKLNSPMQKTKFLDKKQDEYRRPWVVFEKNVELPALNLDEHSIIGEKLLRHLTESTKLFTM